MATTEYKRSQGKQLTYTIDYTGFRYEIWLDGKMLAQYSVAESVPRPLTDPDQRLEVSLAQAKRDIEILRGMDEE